MDYFVGRLIRTLKGELDSDEHDQERVTPPGSVGFLADENQPRQWAAHFGDAAVYLEEEGNLDDPEQYQLLRLGSDLGLTHHQQAEVDARIDALPSLLKSAGPAYTFWQEAVDASLHGDVGLEAVDWAEVQLVTIRKSMMLGQSAEDVQGALLKHSPGAVADVQVAALQAQIEWASFELAAQAEAAAIPSIG